jgi:hypothetical protein
MTTGLPTLSQIQSWDVEHLIDAANHWEATADRWDSAFGDIWQQSIGMDWRGAANDALMDRTTADKTLVARKSEPLREAAKIARVGAGDIDAAKRAALYKVDDTYEAGFIVGEDLSVTDTRSSKNAAKQAARQAQAQAFSGDLRHRAAYLSALDSEVGTKLTSTAGDVGSASFTEKPINMPDRNGQIHLVDFKQNGPEPAPQPVSSDGSIKLPPRTTPPPVMVIDASPPGTTDTPTRHGVGFPNCPPEAVIGHALEVLGGGAGAALGIAGEAPTLGGATLGVLAGGSAVWNGIEGLEQCK